MIPSLLHCPRRAIVFVMATLLAARSMIAAPAADFGTAVSSALDPVPNTLPEANVTPSGKETNFEAEYVKDEIKKRHLDIDPATDIPTSATIEASYSARKDTKLAGKTLKRFAKRQLQSVKNNFGIPDINAEKSAIASAADGLRKAADAATSNMETVANQALQNAAVEQQVGVNNPNFQGSNQPFIWPSNGPKQLAWPINSGSQQLGNNQGVQALNGVGGKLQNGALQPEAVVPGWNDGQGEVQVLDGLGNSLKNGAIQPAAMIPGAEQYFDPSLFDESPALQVLDGTGNPNRDNALQPAAAAIVPVADNGWQNGAEQYFDPTLFDELPLQILDGTGNPFENGALQSETIVNGPEQFFDPTLFDEPVQVLDGLGNPLKNGALQPDEAVQGFQNGPEQYFDPSLFNEPALQVLDGAGNLVQNGALQPEAIANGPEQYFDPTLFNEPVQALDGLGNPLQGGALQPDEVVPAASGLQNSPEQYFDPSLFGPVDEPFQVLDGTGNPIRNNALQPAEMVNGPEQYFDPTLFNEPLQVFDGAGNPIQNGALQPADVVNGPEQYFDPTLFNEPVQVLDGLGNQFEGPAALAPESILPDWQNGPEQYFGPSLFDENQPVQILDGLGNPIQNSALWPADMVTPSGLQVLDGLGNPLQNGALQPAEFVTPDDAILGLSQTPQGQVIQNLDNAALPAIASDPNLWSQALGDPNVQGFLQNNDPANLQPFLDPKARLQFEQNPNTTSNLFPGLNTPSPDQIAPFVNFLDNLTPQEQSNLVNNGPGIAQLASTNPDELSQVLDQADALKNAQPVYEQNRNFDSSLSQPQIPSDTFNSPGTSQADSIHTNLVLPGGGVLTFNCVPVYVDSEGVQHPAADIPSQVLNALRMGGMGASLQDSTSATRYGGSATSFDIPLAPLLNEVVSQNPDEIVTASQVSPKTVLINTDQINDAEEVFTRFDNGWDMTATDTDGANGFDTVTLEKGGTKFDITNPSGFVTSDIMSAQGPGQILDDAFNQGAGIMLESTAAAA
ncbi:hypothetical protein ABW20_dc0106052 [Dactylellina cionopaga]|nr:hypothetical protein ABW20_dc0106052 [Dactylellina cionopaga]